MSTERIMIGVNTSYFTETWYLSENGINKKDHKS